jgi:WhiB family redox-sensing transcriptional regulator
MNIRDLLAPPSWHALAACRGGDLDKWFPEQGANQTRIAMLKAICATCPVRAECLDEALANFEAWGVFGGMTRDERREEARRRGLTRPHHGGQPTPECGTEGGYQRHRRTTFTEPCEACRAAHSANRAARKNGGVLPDKPDVVNHPEMVGMAARWARIA